MMDLAKLGERITSQLGEVEIDIDYKVTGNQIEVATPKGQVAVTLTYESEFYSIEFTNNDIQMTTTKEEYAEELLIMAVEFSYNNE